MSISESENAHIFNFLFESGCCKRCCLRFLNHKVSNANFSEAEETLKKQFPNSDSNEQICKKIKPNSCIVCLDLLSDKILDTLVNHPDLKKVEEYDSKTVHPYITYPTAVYIREHIMSLKLKEKFPEVFKETDIMPLNKAWLISIKDKLAEKINKTCTASKMHVHFITSYEDDEKEAVVLFKIRNNNSKNAKEVSRKYLIENLKDIDESVFKEQMVFQHPTTSLTVDAVNLYHDHIFIAGRYCKYSRQLSQTPWLGIEGNSSICKTSVQEIIFSPLKSVFRCQNLVFSSSGREDVDVRTLGKGRPFYIKVVDPKITEVSYDSFRFVEKEIKQSNLISVRDLQFADKICVDMIKKGEEHKRKVYRAVCIVDKPENLDSYVSKINDIGSVEVQQLTPVRVFHRRTRQARIKNIHSVSAQPILNKDNLLRLDLVTQAGTYVKEFVHGDLFRTKPSLRDITGGFIDIVALDVMKIELDYPPYLYT